MFPDVLGYQLETGVEILKSCGFNSEDLVISGYLSPKRDIIGNDIRILRTDIECGKITIVISYF